MGTMVKAAAVQISPVLYSRQGTVEKVVKSRLPYRTSSDPNNGSCSIRQ
jgi:hypothetical protein